MEIVQKNLFRWTFVLVDFFGWIFLLWKTEGLSNYLPISPIFIIFFYSVSGQSFCNNRENRHLETLKIRVLQVRIWLLWANPSRFARIVSPKEARFAKFDKTRVFLERGHAFHAKRGHSRESFCTNWPSKQTRTWVKTWSKNKTKNRTKIGLLFFCASYSPVAVFFSSNFLRMAKA